ncbi:hypothetical protein ScPMuIL_013114 [Solemya velum]
MAEQDIVMTPSKVGKATHIKIERKKKSLVQQSSVEHVAGGQHAGLVINKAAEGDEENNEQSHLQISFNCFLVDQKNGGHVVERRRLRFWYVDGTDYLDQVTTAYEFFKELVKPDNFPRDYVGFIKKCMKQMQRADYLQARKINLEIQQLDDEEAPLSPGLNKEDIRPKEEIVREKLLHVLESAYPNIMAVEDLVRITTADEIMVTEQLAELKHRDLVRTMENGGVVRHVLDEKTEVQMVKQMPTIAANQQPTIAIITGNYCEKLAVDSMMESKTTFVRFKTEGESNVYTVGYIGEHKVVSTKLPTMGHYRAAQISAGNTTTRLLGTFQNIEHVFVVGVAGGVPHYTDYYKHVRLGDIVVSMCHDNSPVYINCEKILQDRDGKITYNIKSWGPREFILQNICSRLRDIQQTRPEYAPWERYVAEGLELLKNQEADYNRPAKSSDRLYMDVGDNNVIEVQHPECPEGFRGIRAGVPNVHFGVIGAGRSVMKSDTTRLDFANRNGIIAYDGQFDQVLESIVGNRKDSFLFIRGIADYHDGSRIKDWQPYASLVAAGYMKAIIKSISNPHLSEDED